MMFLSSGVSVSEALATLRLVLLKIDDPICPWYQFGLPPEKYSGSKPSHVDVPGLSPDSEA